jgi:hypothetical protein
MPNIGGKKTPTGFVYEMAVTTLNTSGGMAGTK